MTTIIKFLPWCFIAASVKQAVTVCYFAAVMKESIRNRLPGTIKSVVSGKVLREVLVETDVGETATVRDAPSGRDKTLKLAVRPDYQLPVNGC